MFSTTPPPARASWQRRRLRLVRLDRLVKTKYKGLDAVRERDGEEAAIEEFFRRRRGERCVGFSRRLLRHLYNATRRANNVGRLFPFYNMAIEDIIESPSCLL